MTFAPVIWDAAPLRGLDGRARGDLALAATRREFVHGALLFRAGDAADQVFVVERGAFSVEARDGSVLRRAGAGEALGEEALVFGFGSRLSSVRCAEVGSVVALPAALLRRVWQRAGTSGHMAKLTRSMTRGALRDALRASVLDLGENALEVVLDGTRLLEVSRGDVVIRAREPRRGLYVVVEGLVRLEDAHGLPAAHLRAGDAFRASDESERAVAAGPAWLAFIAADAIAVAGLATKVATIAIRCEDAARAAHLATSSPAALLDLARLETGRSMLVMDGDACVRCGQCAAACADAHVDHRTRLVRRGPIVSFDGFPSAILPSSCEHCRLPACLPVCPTGAIERSAVGIVTLREDLCTGCGSCAKACPWDNLALAPRLKLDPGLLLEPAKLAQEYSPGTSPDVAIKCDLCTGRNGGPACVSACPTRALVRVDGASRLGEVAGALRRPHDRGETLRPAAPSPRSLDVVAASLVAVGLVAIGRAGSGTRLALGVVAAIGMLALATYGIAKRAPKLRARLQLGRLTMPMHYAIHVLVGVTTFGAALGHASAGGRATTLARAALFAFVAAAGSGVIASAIFRFVPRRLSRLTRHEWLPEDAPARARLLSERITIELSGKSDLVKAVFARVLDPYRRSPWTLMRIVATGASVDRETTRLRQRVEGALEGRGHGKLEGLETLLISVVDDVCFRVARGLLVLLRAFVPLHVVATVGALVLVLLHAGTEVFR